MAFIALAISLTLLIKNWPFTEQSVKAALQDRFARQVEIRSFRRTYFPPGCVAEGVTFLHHQRKDLPPLISVETLSVRGSYTGLLGIHKRVPQVQVVGLRVTVPPTRPGGGGVHSVMPLTDSTSGKQLGIGQLSTDGAVLEFLTDKPGKEPFKLTVEHLSLDHVGESKSIPFHAALHNTEPPGEIRSDGSIGPWNDDDPGSTPVSGTYTFDHADLGVFDGIAGTLISWGKFSGTLQHLDAQGETDVPNFRASKAGHPVHLSSHFAAVVDATNGDTYLHEVQSHFRRTTVITSGAITSHPGRHGKTAALDMTVKTGRIEDLLFLLTETERPSMTGNVSLRAKVDLPPPPPSFLRRLNLTGDVGVGAGRFTHPEVQVPVNRLTEGARGESKAQQLEDPQTVLSNLRGHVSLTHGVATLSNVSFTAPGTDAEISGTYNLLDKKLNLRGVLHTEGKLSDTTSGFKAIVLKAVGPFLKKKNVTVVPFTITGTSSDPSFALDLAGKRRI